MEVVLGTGVLQPTCMHSSCSSGVVASSLEQLRLAAPCWPTWVHTPQFQTLYCTVLYCTVLYCTVLYCTMLYCTALTLAPSSLVSSLQPGWVQAPLCRMARWNKPWGGQ